MDFINQSLFNAGGFPLSNIWYSSHVLASPASFTSVNIASDSEVYATMRGATNDSYAYFLKLNSVGQHEWIYRFKNSLGNITFRAIQVTKEGNYLYGLIFGNYISAIVKLNLDGSPVWIKSLQQSSGNVISPRSITILDSNIYIAGAYSVPFGSIVGFVAKFNIDGVLQWQKFYSSSSSDVIFNSVDSYSNAIVLSGREGTKSLVISLDTEGTISWAKTFVGLSGGTDEAYGINILSSTSDIYICGKTYNSTTAKNNGYVLVVNSTGTTLTQNIISNSTDNIIFNAISSTGNPRIVGTLGTETTLVQKFVWSSGSPLSISSEYKISLSTGACLDKKGEDVVGGGYLTTPLLFRYTDTMSKPKSWGIRTLETTSFTQNNTTAFTVGTSSIVASMGSLISNVLVPAAQEYYIPTNYEVNNGSNSI